MKKFRFLVIAFAAIFLTGVPMATPIEAQSRQAITDFEHQTVLARACVEEFPRNWNDWARIRRPNDNCRSSIGGSGNPTIAPSTPSSINYPPYTNGNSIRIDWSVSNGNDTRLRYELYERKNSGSWIHIYDGSSTSRTLTNKKKGLYSYRVRAKRGSQKSSYRTGGKSVINPRQANNLYLKYPSTMSGMDQKNTQYRSSTEGIKTVLKKAKLAGQTNLLVGNKDRFYSDDYSDSFRGAHFEDHSNSLAEDEGRFYLGDGFDLVRGTLKETCLNVNHPNFVISKTPPLQPSTFNISYVNDNRHLAELLEVSASAQIGFSSDDFSVDLSGEKEHQGLYSITIRVISFHLILH